MGWGYTILLCAPTELSNKAKWNIAEDVVSLEK